MPLLACLLLCAQPQALAPAAPAHDVVVQGARRAPRSREALAASRGVVDGLTHLTRFDGLIVRRFYPPCIRVIGAAEDYAAAVALRIREASDLVKLGACAATRRPDVLVVFTPEVERFVRLSGLRDWRNQGERFVAAERERLEPAPVRVASFKTFGQLPSATSGTSSRIHRSVIDFYDRTVLLVRLELAARYPADALGDYLAMLALTSADETSASPEPSIVNLLTAREGEAPARMTAWDHAYLRAYYKAFAEQPDAVVLGQIAHQMVNEGLPTR